MQRQDRPPSAQVACALEALSRIAAAAAEAVRRSCRRATVSISASRSIAEPSLTMMPFPNRRPAATTWTTGTARPSAQGQVMIRTATAIEQSPASSRRQKCPSRGRSSSASEVHDRRIERRGAVGDPAIARPPALGRLHQAR